MLFASWWWPEGWPSLGELWQWLVDVIVCSMKRWLCWVIEKLFGWLEAALDLALETLPEPPAVNLAPVNSFWAAVGYWVPTTLLVSLIGAYGVWIIAFLVLRTVKKFIPTLT